MGQTCLPLRAEGQARVGVAVCTQGGMREAEKTHCRPTQQHFPAHKTSIFILSVYIGSVSSCSNAPCFRTHTHMCLFPTRRGELKAKLFREMPKPAKRRFKMMFDCGF